jgi:hypothetical protein
VECAEFRAALVAESSRTDPRAGSAWIARALAGDASDLAAHAACCPQCAHSLAALAAALGEGETNATDARDIDDASRATERALARERGIRAWLRSRPTRWRAGFVLAIAALFVTLFSAASPRVDLGVYPSWRIALCAAVYALALGALVWRALLPLHRLPAAGHDRVWLALGLALPFMLAALPPVQLSAPVSTVGQGDNCVGYGVLLGVLFALALRAVDRDLRPGLHGRWLALAGASLTANVALLFHCPITRPMHAWVVHASIVPVALLLVLLLAAGARKALAVASRFTRSA